MSWADEMLAQLEAPEAWSRVRIRAEAEWAQVWRGRVGFAIVAKSNRVVAVERKRRPIANLFPRICANQENAA